MENFLRDGVDMQVLSSGTIAGEAHFFDDATTPSKVRSYLDSSKEADKLKGMKQLLAMLSKGRDIPEFFADVVKNVVVKSIEVKKMVYIYLVHYADFDANCREIALLSINSFQKDMNGPNQLIRGLALRVMTSIRVPDIIQIQLLAVRKCSGDSSPYVRKCAANALVKIYLLDKEQLESLKQILSSLLKDSSTMVLGSAVAAFNEICPTAYDVLHRNYRKLCHLLADMDEWTQISVLEVMTRYVRNQFTDPAPDVAAVVKLQAKQRSSAAVKGRTTTVVRRVVKKAFYSDEEDESEEETVEVKAEVDHQAVLENAINHDSADNLDPDHRLILKSSLPLLKSRNSGVVLGVCSLHYYCGSQSTTTTAAVAKALVRILRNRREVQYVVLNSISTMARERPLMFRPYLTDFLVKSSDPHFNKMLKLEILASICYKDNITPILREMETYVKDSNQKFVAAAVKAIGRIADCDPKVSDSCIEGVMHLLLCSKKSETVTSACVVVLRQLLQQNTTSAASHKVLHQLVKLLIIEDGIEEPVARSSIVWLVGEFHSVLVNVAPDILRILASGFIDESTETKTQILNLAIKLSLQLPEDENVQSLMTYVLEMSRYDLDTDLRDRSRFMTALMGLAPSNEEGDAPPIDEDALAEFAEHAGAIMLAPKLPPITLIDTAADDGALSFTVGSMSALVGHYLQGYEPLSAWPAVQPNADVRDALKYAEQDAKEAATAGGGGTHSGSRKGRKGGDDSSSEEEDLMAVFSKKKGKKDDSSSSSSSSSGSESESGSGSGSESEEEDSGEESSDSESSEDEKAKNNKKKAASKTAATGSGKASTAKAPASGGKGKTANLLGGSDSDSGKSESSSSGKEESSESESEEDEKPAARVPLAAQKVQPTAKPSPAASAAAPVVAAAATKPAGVTRVGMRKVAPGKKKDPFGGSAEPLAATLVDYGESHETPLAPAAATRSAASQPAVTVSDVEDELDDFLLDVPTEKKQTKTFSTSAAATGGHDDLLVGGSASMQTSNVMSSAFNAPSANDLVDKFAGMDFTSSGSGMGSAPSSGKLSHDAILSSFNNPTSAGGAGAASPSTAAVMGGGVVMSGGIQLTRPPEASAASLGVPVGSINFEDLAEPKVLLKPELGGGLTVSLVIRNNVTSVAYVGAVSAYLLVKNVNKDRTLRRVRVNFPTDMRKTTVPEIPVMNPMQEVQFPMELVLSGITGKQVKVDIRCDQGAYVGLLVINDWDLLLPFTTTSSEFEVQRKRLGGFNEIVKAYPTSAFQFSNEDIADNELELISRVKKVVNVYLVQGAGVGELMFAGTVRKALVEEKVFITILAAADQVTFKFNSEDPLLSTGLNEAFKKLMPKLPAASCISL